MFYLMPEWFNNPKREGKVRLLLEELGQDIKDENSITMEQVIIELESIGETKIADMLKNNQLPIGI